MSDRHSHQSSWRQHWPSFLLTFTLVILAFGLYGSKLIPGLPSSTPREQFLENLFLTAASVAVGWLFTKIYAAEALDQRLRDQGVQIARSILELKIQLADLGDWIDNRRVGYSSYPDQRVVASRADSDLDHVRQTVFNIDRTAELALHGIGGVIGDAIQQHAEVMRRIGAIRDEEEKLKGRLARQLGEAMEPDAIRGIEEKLAELERDSQKQVEDLRKQAVLPLPDAPPRRRLSHRCPYCHTPNGFDMTDRAGETRVVTCEKCQRPFNAHLLSGGSIIVRRLDRPGATEKSVQLPTTLPILAGAEFVGEARASLKKGGLLCDPRLIPRVSEYLVAVDRSTGISGKRTIYQLQKEALSMLSATPIKMITASAVRAVSKGAMLGRAFSDDPATPPHISNEYSHALTAELVTGAYVEGVALWLAQRIQVRESDAETIAVALLNDRQLQSRAAAGIRRAKDTPVKREDPERLLISS